MPEPFPTVTLPPDLTKRLQAIQAILEVGDTELARASAARLADHGEEPAIAAILDHLQNHRYAEAKADIDRVLSEGTRIVPWEDPEIALLDAEAERLAADLAGVESEKAELDHLLIRFQAAYQEALGDQIRELLRLRRLKLEREAERNPSRRAAFEEAKRDSEEFERDSESQKQKARESAWNLTDEEQKEMKTLFRQAAKKSHPDAVPPQFRDAAGEMFRRLRAAHESGDLATVRKLAQQIAAGLFDAVAEAGEDIDRRKQRLRARISGLREALAQARAGLDELTGSSTYRRMMDNPDWDAFFEQQKAKLAEEVTRLQSSLETAASDPPVRAPEPEPIAPPPVREPVRPATRSAEFHPSPPPGGKEPEPIQAGPKPITHPIPCPGCGFTINVHLVSLGKAIKCRRCGKRFVAATPVTANPRSKETSAVSPPSPTPKREPTRPDETRQSPRLRRRWIAFALFWGWIFWMAKRPPDPAAPEPPPFTEPEQPLPASGTTEWFNSEPRVAPFKITSTAGSNYLIKLEDELSGRDVVTMFVWGGRTEAIQVPLGTYIVKYASGSTWYGPVHLFGPRTEYSKADRSFRFGFDGRTYSGFTITLYRVANGNLHTSTIGPSQF